MCDRVPFSNCVHHIENVDPDAKSVRQTQEVRVCMNTVMPCLTSARLPIVGSKARGIILPCFIDLVAVFSHLFEVLQHACRVDFLG